MSDDVAAELAALGRAQRETGAIARESAGLLAELAPQVHDLAQQLHPRPESAGYGERRRLGDAGGPHDCVLAAELGMADVPPTPWCWPLLDPEQAAAAWDALTRWVDHILVPGYGINREQLPDCWPHHSRMVNELSWLRAAHLEAHAAGAAAALAQDWHLRALPGAFAALHAAVPLEHGAGGRRRPLCGPGHHDSRAEVRDDDVHAAAGMPARPEYRRPAPARAAENTAA